MSLSITHIDLGHPTEPGDYVLGDAVVRVDRQHLMAWQETPDAAFNAILCTRAGDTNMRLTLGDRTA